MDGTETIVSSGIVLDVNGLTALEGVFLDEGGASQGQQKKMEHKGLEPTPGEEFPLATEGPELTSSEEFPPAQFPYLGSLDSDV